MNDKELHIEFATKAMLGLLASEDENNAITEVRINPYTKKQTYAKEVTAQKPDGTPDFSNGHVYIPTLLRRTREQEIARQAFLIADAMMAELANNKRNIIEE